MYQEIQEYVILFPLKGLIRVLSYITNSVFVKIRHSPTPKLPKILCNAQRYTLPPPPNKQKKNNVAMFINIHVYYIIKMMYK